MFASRQVGAHALAVIVLSFVTIIWQAGAVLATTVGPGTIVVGSTIESLTSVDTRLLAVDPTTGATSLLSGDGVGTGPSFDFGENTSAISYVSQQTDGSLLVTDSAGWLGSFYESRLYRVDPSTGNRSIVADITTSSSAALFWSARQVGSTIIATNQTGLQTIDPTTGTVAPFAVTGVNFPGNSQNALRGFAVSGSDIYVASPSNLYKIDIATGAGSVLTSLIVGNDVSIDSAGNLYALIGAGTSQQDGTTIGTFGVYHIDPITGNQVPVSVTSNTTPPAVPTVGAGPLLGGLTMATTATGDILAMNLNGELLSIDPVTGDRTLVSQIPNAWPSTTITCGVVVLTNVPEPGTATLAALAFVGVLMRRNRCNQRLSFRAVKGLAITLVCAVAVSWQIPACAVTLNPGDIVITADLGTFGPSMNFGLVEIDPSTGNRTIISDATHGTGPQMFFPNTIAGVVRAPGGQLLVAAQNGIFSVDPSTGDRALLSSTAADDVATYGGQIFADAHGDILNIDPTTGNATLLFESEGYGSMAVEAGTFYVSRGFDVAGFSRSGALISRSNADGTLNTVSLAPYADGTLLLAGSTLTGGPASGVGIYSPALDSYQTVSSALHGTGIVPWTSAGLGVAANGTIWDAVPAQLQRPGEVLAIDPVTGNRTILSDATHGLGPTFVSPAGLVVIPEPGTAMLLMSGAIGVIALQRCRR
jgi:hypothetical protein